MTRLLRLRVITACFASLLSLLAGCASSRLNTEGSIAGPAVSGHVMGGQQPVAGAKVYLYAASAAGYSGAATSLLSGGFVTTDAGGNFSITGLYTCPAGAQVYALALGGNPGLSAGTNNAELALMSGFGSCTTLQATPRIAINEETTVAAVYALQQFMTSETLVGTSSTNAQGLINAFATIPNLVSPVSGLAPPTTPAANGTVPVQEINSLANSLAACVNSDGTGTPCSSLMSAANVTGTGGTPIDTIQAALNIAKNPAVNVSAIYNLATASAPFLPTLSSAPNDWTMSLEYTGGINQSQGLAIDATGNVWISNLYSNNIEEFSNTGALLSPVTGYTTVNFYHPQRVAIDLTGNIWVPGQTQYDPNTNALLTPATVAKFSSNGTVLSGTGFTGGGYVGGFGILVDASNNVWAAQSSRIAEFTNAGAAISPSTGYTGGGLSSLISIALDSLGNVWATSASGSTVNGVTTHTGTLSKFSSAGVALSPSTGYSGGGLYYPQYLAIDGSNNLWTPSFYGAPTGSTTYGGIVEFNSGGTALSPSPTGYPIASTVADWTFVDGAGVIWSGAGCTPAGYLCTLNATSNTGAVLSGATGYLVPNLGFAPGIDASGNLWVSGITTLSEVVGIAAPVVTPLVKAATTGKLGTRP